MSAIPKILIRIKQEKAWLGRFAAREELDLVISDNRYGLTIPQIPCIFITHQLLIKTPLGPGVDRILLSLNYRAIRRFSRCWIPDIAIGGLAGELSHPDRLPPVPTRYIGWLSRFGPPADATTSTEPVLLVLVSGPEPQRTLLEKNILGQARALAGVPACRMVIVRGLPNGGDQPLNLPSWITLHDHLPARAMEPLLRDATLVVSRPGYSTVMDLERLGKRALFIPTPGQSEQEYLGPYLAAKGWAHCVRQHAFSLVNALEIAGKGMGDRERQPEEAGLLAAEIKAALAVLEKSAAGEDPNAGAGLP